MSWSPSTSSAPSSPGSAVNQTRFEEGRKAYEAGDFRASAKAFLEAAGRGEGSGRAYHMAGNSFLKLRRYGDAVTVYRHALADEGYEERASVHCNMAAAHVALGEYPEAVEAYDVALEDPAYINQYRALQGKAGALFEMGKIEKAAMAYRQAALDGDNPDPGKALNNLGLCFMRLDRPTDAVEAYRAALGFDTYSGRGRALSNLGMAYHVIGCHEDAIKAFEKARELHGHELSGAATTAYGASQDALRAPAEREVVEGWSTGEMTPLPSEVPSKAPPVGRDPFSSARESMAPTEEVSDDDEVGAFFAMSDEEMRDRDRSQRRAQKAERGPWALIGTVLVGLVLVIALFAGAFLMGVGYPTQQMTVSGMLDARAGGRPVAAYWVAVPTADIDKEMAKLPPMREYEIGEIERSPRTSRVSVIVTPESGAPLSYEITLAREGVGWKVTGVENDWRSTGGGS